MNKTQKPSFRWYFAIAKFTQTESSKRAKQYFAHHGFSLLIFATLIAGMTLWGVTYPAQAQENSPFCKIVTSHVARDDVAYKAGVDVHGNAVVPADLNASPLQLPEVMKVPFDINLAERVSTLVGGLQLEAPLGMLEIHKDGRVLYNDQDLSSPVMALCGQSHKIEVEQDRQSEEDIIRSEPVMEATEIIEVEPTVAVPPQDINVEPTEIEEPEDEIIEGGDYREIYYNE